MSNFQFIALIFEDIFWARPLNAPLMAVVFAAVFFLSLFLYRKAWAYHLELEFYFVSCDSFRSHSF